MKLNRIYSFDIVFIAIIHISGIIGIRLFPELFLKTSLTEWFSSLIVGSRVDIDTYEQGHDENYSVSKLLT